MINKEIGERWDSLLPSGQVNPGGMTSFNHYALGSVASFIHTTIGGISPLSPGYKVILISPQPGGGVTFARTTLLSPYGKIACEWKLQQMEDGTKRFWIRVEIPMNTTAMIKLPGFIAETQGTRAGSGKLTVPA
jgi:alpha-L-rhamnosidase